MPFLHASVRTADESPELIDHLQVELPRLATGLLGKVARSLNDAGRESPVDSCRSVQFVTRLRK